jgi:hypothetical protein
MVRGVAPLIHSDSHIPVWLLATCLKWNSDSMTCEHILSMSHVPSGKLTVCELENGPVEIVELPSYKMVDLSIVCERLQKKGILHMLVPAMG